MWSPQHHSTMTPARSSSSSPLSSSIVYSNLNTPNQTYDPGASICLHLFRTNLLKLVTALIVLLLIVEYSSYYYLYSNESYFALNTTARDYFDLRRASFTDDKEWPVLGPFTNYSLYLNHPNASNLCPIVPPKLGKCPNLSDLLPYFVCEKNAYKIIVCFFFQSGTIKSIERSHFFCGHWEGKSKFDARWTFPTIQLYTTRSSRVDHSIPQSRTTFASVFAQYSSVFTTTTGRLHNLCHRTGWCLHSLIIRVDKFKPFFCFLLLFFCLRSMVILSLTGPNFSMSDLWKHSSCTISTASYFTMSTWFQKTIETFIDVPNSRDTWALLLIQCITRTLPIAMTQHFFRLFCNCSNWFFFVCAHPQFAIPWHLWWGQCTASWSLCTIERLLERVLGLGRWRRWHVVANSSLWIQNCTISSFRCTLQYVESQKRSAQPGKVGFLCLILFFISLIFIFEIF